MNNSIYYPNFEIENENWLKFALLYVDTFRPIIPEERKSELSDLYKKIINETNLINPITPDFSHKEKAYITTQNFLSELFENKNKQNMLFKSEDLRKKWIKEEKTFLIYKEKMNDNFINYCNDNKLGKKSKDGIFLSEDLYQIYMTNLAKVIAGNEYSIVTDKINYTKYNTISQSNDTQLYKSIIRLNLPLDLNSSEVDKLLEFRKKDENQDLIIAFNKMIVELKNADNIDEQLKLKICEINDTFLKKISVDLISLIGKISLLFSSQSVPIALLGSILTSLDNVVNISDSFDERSNNMYLKANSYLVNIRNEF